MHIAVLAGGLSAEREVSLRSGRRVAEALRDAGAEVTELDADEGLISRLQQLQPDAVVPLLHGAAGEDGSLADVLASLDFSVVGAHAGAARMAFDKPVAKELAARHGIATPAAIALPHSMFRELGAAALMDVVARHLGLPMIVKPARGGSALGMSLVSEPTAFAGAMVGAFAYGDVALMEQQVVGTEIAVSVLDTGDGPQALPIVEIVAPNGVYDYAARYTAGTTEFFVPARIDANATARAIDAALTMHTVLGLSDWSRIDFIVDGTGMPWFLEANVAPGMTETSLFPQSLHAAGRDLGATVLALATHAVNR